MKPEAGRTSNNGPSPWTSEARRNRARLEAGTLCEALRDDVARGVLPPDDAYWWTRIVSGEAEMLLEAA